jgi:hypothetical protein
MFWIVIRNKISASILVMAVMLSCSFNLFSQDNAKYSLIVIHYDPASKTDFKQLVYSYHFLNGHYMGREELMSFKGRMNNADYVRTDKGNNFIYQNRYLITGAGSIIDLKDKKILFDQRANLVRCSNDSAIYYTNDVFKGKFYSVYNFTTKQYSEVKKLTFKAIVGQDAEFDKTTAPFHIDLYPTSKPKISLTTDAGFGQTLSDNKKIDPSLIWLDNSNFIFCKFNKENTNIDFVKMNVDTKTQTIIGKATIKPQNELGFFTKINNGLLQYSFGEKRFLLDIEKNTVTELLFSHPENNFSVECKTNSYGHIIKLNGKEIGKYHFQLKNFKCDNNIAGIVKELVVGTDSYQQGMAVWNNTKPGWEAIDCEDVVALIGWIKD